jgi:hypothetical protein
MNERIFSLVLVVTFHCYLTVDSSPRAPRAPREGVYIFDISPPGLRRNSKKIESYFLRHNFPLCNYICNQQFLNKYSSRNRHLMPLVHQLTIQHFEAFSISIFINFVPFPNLARLENSIQCFCRKTKKIVTSAEKISLAEFFFSPAAKKVFSSKFEGSKIAKNKRSRSRWRAKMRPKG